MVEIADKNEDALFRYTGLSLGQYRNLHLASVGGLLKLNPARAKFMAGLIGPDLWATEAGFQMMRLVELLAEQDWYVGPRDFIKITHKDLTSHLRILKSYSCGELRSAHLKALIAIYNAGSLSERFLSYIYGDRIVNDLIRLGVIQPGALLSLPGWRSFRLTAAGDMWVQNLVFLQSGKSLI